MITLTHRQAEETQGSPPQILAAALSTASDTALVNLPKLVHFRRTIRSQSKIDELSANLINRAIILNLSIEYQQTLSGEQFLSFGSGMGDSKRILIFTTNDAMHLV